MRIRKNGKIVNLTESDLRRIVKRVISEQRKNETEVNKHRYRKSSSPGIEDLLDFYCRFCEMDPRTREELTNEGRILKDRLIYQLNKDVYAANPDNPTNIGRGGTRYGKLRIVLNGREMTPESFVDQIERDSEEGYCHEIRNYTYDNKILGKTKIIINTEDRECKKEPSPQPVKKKECPEIDSGWYDNVIREGGPSSSHPFDWDRVLDELELGETIETVCNCFKKKYEELSTHQKFVYDNAKGFCKKNNVDPRYRR